MIKVVEARAWLSDLDVETVRTDAVQAFLKQETVFVRLATDDGNIGIGYSYTIGTGGTSVLAMLRDHLLPRLIGADAALVEQAWQDLHASTRATSVGAITSLALAAVDTALWDLRCTRAGEPLWRFAGGFRPKVPLYDTEGGWLQLSTAELVNGALASRAAGWPGVKLKVGKPQVEQDLERLRAVRAAVGPGLDLMMDASQSLTHAEARRRAAAFEPLGAVRGPDLGGTADRRRLGACPGRPQTAEYEGAPDRRPGLPLSRSADLDLDLVQPLGLAWFEEPLPADDVAGHASLAASTSIPVAVGESLYSVGQFRDYLARGAASIVQADVARVGGITPWLKIAHLAEAFNVHICPHFLMELHVSLVAAVPNGRYVEHIPQLRAITRSSLRIENGHAVAPEAPGLGIDWDFDAIDDRTVA